MSTTIYGIANCDTVKKTRRWLQDNGIEYRFHDLRTDGLDAVQLRGWLAALGWENLVNRRSSSWKALAPGQRDAMDDTRAVAAILAAPTLIRRPLLERDNVLEVGFSATRYAQLFGA